jgi:hypothetical protein
MLASFTLKNGGFVASEDCGAFVPPSNSSSTASVPVVTTFVIKSNGTAAARAAAVRTVIRIKVRSNDFDGAAGEDGKTKDFDAVCRRLSLALEDETDALTT